MLLPLSLVSALAFAPSTAGSEWRVVEADGHCNLESVNGKPFVDVPSVIHRGEKLVVAGWLVDRDKARTPLRARVVLQNGDKVLSFPIRRRVYRPDVALHFKTEQFLVSGFQVDLPTNETSQGKWRVQLRYLRASEEVRCDNGRVLEVVP